MTLVSLTWRASLVRKRSTIGGVHQDLLANDRISAVGGRLLERGTTRYQPLYRWNTTLVVVYIIFVLYIRRSG